MQHALAVVVNAVKHLQAPTMNDVTVLPAVRSMRRGGEGARAS